MTSEAPAFSALSGDLPSAWREAVQKQLRPHENVLAALEVDLDQQLHFVKGLVLLTNQRLLACEGQRRFGLIGTCRPARHCCITIMPVWGT